MWNIISIFSSCVILRERNIEIKNKNIYSHNKQKLYTFHIVFANNVVCIIFSLLIASFLCVLLIILFLQWNLESKLVNHTELLPTLFRIIFSYLQFHTIVRLFLSDLRLCFARVQTDYYLRRLFLCFVQLATRTGIFSKVARHCMRPVCNILS